MCKSDIKTMWPIYFIQKKKQEKTNKPRQSLFVSSCAFVSESWCLYSHSVSDYTYAFTRIISTQAVQVWPWPQTSLFLLHLILFLSFPPSDTSICLSSHWTVCDYVCVWADSSAERLLTSYIREKGFLTLKTLFAEMQAQHWGKDECILRITPHRFVTYSVNVYRETFKC